MSSIKAQLDDWWDRFYAPIRPIPHLLRKELSDRWVRFHNLPDSKRYPSTDNERTTILERQNAILGVVLPNATPVLVFGHSWRSDDGTEPLSFKAELGDDVWQRVGYDRDDEVGTLSLGCVQPHKEDWNRILLRIAEDDLASCLIIDPVRAAFLHPYDGGVDVFAATSDERNAIKTRFIDWLPTSASGL